MQKWFMKAASLVACIALCGSIVMAENFVVPFDNNGNLPSDINLIGADVFVDTGLAAIGSTSPVILFGYSVSSDAAGNFAMLRDSNTLNTTSNIKLTLYPDGQSTNSAQTLTQRLPVPVIFRNGLSINLNAAVTGANAVAGSSRGRWMFYFRYLRESNVPGKTPSQVDPRISVDNVGVN